MTRAPIAAQNDHCAQDRPAPEGFTAIRRLALPVAAFLLPFFLTTAANANVSSLGRLKFEGKVLHDADVSAVAAFGDYLMIGSDETTVIQILKRSGNSPDVYQATPSATFELAPGNIEVDIEAITRLDDVLFVAGSHALLRKQVKSEESSAVNRARMEQIVLEPNRCHIYRVPFDPKTLKAGEKSSINLRPLMLRDPVLAPFCRIPSKENGVDIEGLATDGSLLFVGFRSPVLRGNYVPVMVFPFSSPQKYEIRYVNLRGLGIRELVKVKGGFLILAGPAGDGAGDFHLYFWDGRDSIPDRGAVNARIRELDQLPSPGELRPEGIALLNESDKAYEILVVYDGGKNGAPQKFRVSK